MVLSKLTYPWFLLLFSHSSAQNLWRNGYLVHCTDGTGSQAAHYDHTASCRRLRCQLSVKYSTALYAMTPHKDRPSSNVEEAVEPADNF